MISWLSVVKGADVTAETNVGKVRRKEGKIDGVVGEWNGTREALLAKGIVRR